MKKRIMSLIMIAVFSLCMLGSSVSVMAANHGQESHSPSMSVGSGDAPIADQSTTKDAGSSKPVYNNKNSEKSSETAEDRQSTKKLEIETENASEEEIAAEEAAQAESNSVGAGAKQAVANTVAKASEKTGLSSGVIYIILIALLIIIGTTIIVLIFRKPKPEKTEYRSKH